MQLFIQFAASCSRPPYEPFTSLPPSKTFPALEDKNFGRKLLKGSLDFLFDNAAVLIRMCFSFSKKPMYQRLLK